MSYANIETIISETPGTATLIASDPQGSGAYQCTWYRGTATPFALDETTRISPTDADTVFVDNGPLTAGTTYYYVVFVFDIDFQEGGSSTYAAYTMPVTPITLFQAATAIRPGLSTTFYATGGLEPYAWTAAVGTIDDDGLYTAATSISEFDAESATDTITLTDALGTVATATIIVGPPLLLVCDIVRRTMGLANGRVYLWNQKLPQPKDDGIYIAVSVPDSKAFANVNRPDSSGGGVVSKQFISVRATVAFDIISRGPGARDRKEEILLALASDYSMRQQSANSFKIARIPNSNFMNLSEVDGAAIPYRYRVQVAVHYAYEKASDVDYFNSFASPTVLPNA